MSSRHPTEQDWDHKRDLRKHDTPPLPARMDKPLTTAMDIVVLVKAMTNYPEAAALVEQYAGMVAACARVEESRIAVDRLNRLGGTDAQA